MPCKEDKPCPHKILVTCECQRIKQEAKCNASKNSDGNLKKRLKCDEECARLERNHKLAMALNVDPANHQNDHVPYSADTLNMYQENSTWAAAQEKIFRLFAANPDEKRLRFKPMPAHQRAFIHSIAEDFGFDSESMDPEPHRHVAIFKTPRFVMAPMKTLAECSRIRQVQRSSMAAPAAPASAIPSRSKPTNVSGDPFNSFIITNPRFALTIDEVNSVVKSTLPKTNFPVELEVHFLPSEEVALRPPLMTRINVPEPDMQARLESIKPALAQAISSSQIGGKLQLARLDSSLNILRRETDNSPGAGWSQVVAARGAPVRKVDRTAPAANKFAVLSLSSNKKKREKEKMTEVADDWEAAELEEEEKERASGANSGASSARASMDAGAERALDEVSTKPRSMRWEDMDGEA
jgi:transcriptional repressor NF-X1